MAVDLGNLSWFVLVAGDDTPPNLVQYAGRPVGVPPGKALPTTPDTLIINGLHVYGYSRFNGNVGWWEWVMTSQPDPNVTALNLIPGPSGWADADARTVWANIGLYLLQHGIPGSELRPGLAQLYQAAIVNHTAAQNAPLQARAITPPAVLEETPMPGQVDGG